VSKFLIIRFSSIGDIVLTTPVIRCLKQQVPGAEIHFLTKKTFYPLLAANPCIARFFLLEDNMREIIRQLKKENYTAIIDLHHNLRTWRIKDALIPVPSYGFNKLNIEKWLLTTFKINRLPQKHIVDRYLDTVKYFGVKNDGQGLDYFIPESETVHEQDIPTAHQAGYIGIVIGAAHATKKYPAEKLRELCRQINHPLILLGGKEDAATGNEIAAADPVKIYNACGKFSLNESADLVRRSKFIITNDTGLMHIAAAFKKPVISLWGNTVPAFGMTPYYGQFNVQNAMLETTGLRCRPCSKIGYDKCPRGHFKCMNLIDTGSLLQMVKQFLGR
jgi:ADP-heptose:LPS heptosyltransferase